MSKLLIALLVFLSSRPTNDLHLDQPFTHEIENIEEKYGSSLYQPESLYIPHDLFSNSSLFQLEKPIMYLRPKDNFPVESEVHYYFTCDDTVRYVTHIWNNTSTGYRPVSNLSLPGMTDFDVWFAKFNKLKDEITLKLGAPFEESDCFETKQSSSRYIYKERKIKWVTYDCVTTIKMSWSQNIIQYNQETKIIPGFQIETKTFWNEEKSKVICIQNKKL